MKNKKSEILIAVQIDGRVRDEILVPTAATQTEIEVLALARPEVKKWINGKMMKKIILIPNRLINFVLDS